MWALADAMTSRLDSQVELRSIFVAEGRVECETMGRGQGGRGWDLLYFLYFEIW